MTSLPALVVVLLAAGSARAGGDTTPSPAQTEAAPSAFAGEASRPAEAPGTSPPATDAPAMDFNLLPEEPATPVDPELESRIRTRRTLLTIHQGLGIATVALLTTAVVFGQLNYTDRFGGGPNLGTYSLWHSSFAAAATLTFVASGILALAAPVPLDKRSDEVDTITVHKWSMLVATLGFATEFVLGIYAASREGYVNQASIAQAHLVIGYVTLGAVGVGTAALFF